MAETRIEWAHYSFNPWRGCTKVSPGCANCYAEKWAARNPVLLGEWGPDGARVIAAESYWRQPLAWDRAAEKIGARHQVFCASLADVFEDRPELVAPRQRLLLLIHDTPNLDWQLLTKRPENVLPCLSVVADSLREAHLSASACWVDGWADGANVPSNVWLGVSVEDRQRADERIPLLLQTPAAVRFLSCEPLLGPVDLDRGVDWVIVGGESGPGARPCNVAWIRSIVRQCREAGIAVFVKQLGACVIDQDGTRIILRDRKGGDPEEWPEDLRVREFPETANTPTLT